MMARTDPGACPDVADLSLNPAAQTQVIDIDPNAMLAVGMLFGIWMMPMVGSIGALLFLIFGMGMVVRRPISAGQALYRHWYLLLLPAFSLLSFLWSEYPSASLRAAIQFALTIAFVIIGARFLRERGFIRAIFFLYVLVTILSILFGHVRGDTGAWQGIFGSKNSFSSQMLVFWLVSLAIALDKRSPLALRLMGLACAPVAILMVVLAQSAGALLVSGPATLVLLTGLMMRYFTGLQRIAFLTLMTLLGAACLILLITFWDMLFEALIVYTGKDVTLTGRTFIWGIGQQIVAEKPMLGVGFQAFWIPGNPLAEIIWYEFGIVERTGFNFHNMYLHHAVEVGLIGMALHVFVLFGAFFINLYRVLLGPNAENVFFLAFMLQLVIYSLVEVPAYQQFHANTITGFMAFAYGVQALKARRVARRASASGRKRATA